jgi:hypothetical protein
VRDSRYAGASIETGERMTERRSRRSQKLPEALRLYFAAVRQRTGLTALALTTDSGEFVAGSGEVDLEWMGSLGASRRARTLEWNDLTLHVTRLDENGVTMVLTSAGPLPPDEAVIEGIKRIMRE